MMTEKQLVRIEEKLDRLIELLGQPAMITSTYPKAPHEQAQVVKPYRYPWRLHETSSSL